MAWYSSSYRRNLVDMHIEDWNDEFLSMFSPEDYVANLRKAHIQSPMIYLQSHVGYCYWPTASGRMHKAFAGREDTMRRLVDLCHEAGMDVIAYYSLIYNNWAYREHPEWRMIDASGNPSRAGGSRYGLCCPNNQGYRAFVKTQIRELCAYFRFEGIFFDMTFWPMVCYCPSCRSRWSDEEGGEPPMVVDWRDERWRRFQGARERWLGEFAAWATAELKSHKPGCSVEHQYSTAMHSWRYGVTENITLASDYAGGDLYGGIAEQSFACKLYYNLTRNQPFEYMTSRCYPSLLDHTTTKTDDLLALSVMMTTLHHGASLIIDAIDPRGTMDRRVYERIGTVFAESKRYERYLEGAFTQDVGIYYDLSGKMDVESNGHRAGTPEGEARALPHQVAALGAAASLRQHHIPFGVLNNWNLDLLRDVKVLVLPDVPTMQEREQAAVEEFVRAGGTLYLSGHSAPGIVERVFGVRPDGFTEETVTYIAPTPEAGDLLSEFTPDYPMTLFCRQRTLSGTPQGDVLATITLPYTVPPVAHALGGVVPGSGHPAADLDDPTLRFASIHSNPPGIRTSAPAILKRNHGSGTVIWASAPIEACARPQHSDAFANLIRSLQPSFSFESDAPGEVEFLRFDAPAKGRTYVGYINLQEGFATLPVRDFVLSVAVSRRPKKITVVPEGTELPVRYSGGMATVRFKELRRYGMIRIQT